MKLTRGLYILVLCCMVKSLRLKEKTTDHRLIYQSEDIIKQQDAEEAKLRNSSEPGFFRNEAAAKVEDLEEENAIEYIPENVKLPTFDEVNHGKPTETVVVPIDEGLPELCSLPKRTGKCRARHQRFFFNVKTKECEPFVYGGCDGNENRFLTLEECDTACHLPSTL